jgi:hypothetical protein
MKRFLTPFLVVAFSSRPGWSLGSPWEAINDQGSTNPRSGVSTR